MHVCIDKNDNRTSISTYFKLGDKCDKVINMTRAGHREKNLGPPRESNPRLPEHQVGVLFTKLRELMEGETIYRQLCSYVTRVPHTARISHVEVLVAQLIDCTPGRPGARFPSGPALLSR